MSASSRSNRGRAADDLDIGRADVAAELALPGLEILDRVCAAWLKRSVAPTVAISFSLSQGFTTKSAAPSLIALTAVSTPPWAVMKITFGVGRELLDRPQAFDAFLA